MDVERYAIHITLKAGVKASWRMMSTVLPLTYPLHLKLPNDKRCSTLNEVLLLQHSFIQAAKSLSILNNMIQEALNIMEEESAREENEV